ncbi:hypothetical protein H9L14_13765 [Sphingomonas sediminicola]|uniref:Uncharacterized protein n=1 Tax=Sphingomonas sediminicola TaxID=386874 RepID=A0ABX6TA47_9SPHN|nr:hypothetical protein [Sphingomonas sediminicola]QNP45593.1 hypothetical protein H9L14_13765 [Sphingomonas sediminicola]
MAKDVKVEAKKGDKGLIDWEIDGKKAKVSRIEFDKGDNDVLVEFKLQDTTSRKLRFDTEQPIWIHENADGQCPSPGATDKQIEVVSCDDNTLKLVNKNDKESILRYQLNFVDQANKAEPCDPEFKNGGTSAQ